MAKVLVPVSTGFEEIEAVSIVDVLRRAGIEVILAGVNGTQIEGANGISLIMDTTIDDVEVEQFNMIVLPGGHANAVTLANNERVQTLIKDFKAKDKYIGAICAAPIALHEADVLNKNYTCYPSYEEQIRLDGFSDNQKVVKDGKVITSRGPGTAICFGLQIVKELVGVDTYNQLKEGLLTTYCEE